MSDRLDTRELRQAILAGDPNEGSLAPGTSVNELMQDSLTGLMPRQIWEAEMNQFINYAKRTHTNVGLLMMDIDKFKQINDEKGHDAGDEILRNAGTVIRHSFRESDIKGRYGGDEFIVMLTGYLLPNIEKDISDTEADYSAELTKKFGVGVTVGMALWNGSQNLDELIKQADIRLYQNKKLKENVQ